MNDIYYLAALCASSSLGRLKIPQALGLLGSAEALFKATEQELVQTQCFTDKQIGSFLADRSLTKPQELAHFCTRQGVQLVTIYSEDYPKSLKHISDPPLVLYVLGKIPHYGYGVAVVGSRDCTAYGIKAAKYFSSELARKGIPVISGGARGIDTAAHEACLAVGGQTLAVLGCGIDIVYPQENKQLFRRIATQGAVMTEYAPGTKPLSFNFPARNRIVVGLAQAVLVAEARQKSGALITAHIAADEGRDVYAVPGDIFSCKSIGCHDLIRKGAKAVDTVQDILEDYAIWQTKMQSKVASQSIFDYQISEEERLAAEQQKAAAHKEAVAQKLAKQKQIEVAKQEKLKTLSPVAQNIYPYIKTEALSFDEIIESSGVDFMTVSMAILDLQVAGLVREEGVQTYSRV